MSAKARSAFVRGTAKSSPRDDAGRWFDDDVPRRGGAIGPSETRDASDAGDTADPDEPIVLEVPPSARGRLHRLNLFSVDIDRPNVAGTVGASLAWRRDTVPGRSIPTIGSMMTVRLAVNVNLRTLRRTIKRSRSFFFVFGGENGKSTATDRGAFDEQDIETVEVQHAPRQESAARREMPRPRVTEATPEPEPEPAAAREPAPEPEPAREPAPEPARAPAPPAAQPERVLAREPQRERVPRPAFEPEPALTNGTEEYGPSTRLAPTPTPQPRRGREIDELFSAMERTQAVEEERSQAVAPRPAAAPRAAARSEPARPASAPTESARTEPARPEGSADDDSLHPLLQRRAEPEPERRAEPEPRPAEAPALPPPGWYPDPTGRAELRYWDGRWTALVKTDGRESLSPLAAS